jgi:hypothetical protein
LDIGFGHRLWTSALDIGCDIDSDIDSDIGVETDSDIGMETDSEIEY